CDRRKTIELRPIERRDEWGNRTRRRDAGELGSVMKNARGTPRVAQVLEGEEPGTDGFRFGPVLRLTCGKERSAWLRRDASRPGREAREVEVTHVHHRGPFADPADHACTIDAAQQPVEIRV